MNHPFKFILEKPYFFNTIRKVIAGDQKNTKRFVIEALKKNNVKSVLDIGCGTGDFAVCTPKDASYLGIDLNREYIKFAKHEYPSAYQFKYQDVTKKEFYKGKKYDAVLFVSMIHHLSQEELDEILPVVKKVTKKIVVVADIIPAPEGILRKIMVKLDQGRFVRPEKEKEKILKKYFTIVKKEYVVSRLAVQYCLICRV